MGALGDLVRSKELLRRAKDIEHLAQLYEEHPELAADRRPGTLIWGGGIIDRELLLVGWCHVP